MELIRKRNRLIGLYLSVLLVLLLCVSATPLLVRHGLSFNRRLIIEEETLETVLIITLFGISFLILRSFLHTLEAYQRAVNQVGKEKSRLVSRLAEAFSYIGKVNIEIHEIESVLCGVACYPKSKREFRQVVDGLTAKAMTVAAAPWLVVRMIDRHSGHTVNEHAVQRPQADLPSVTMGNRSILDGHRVEGLQTIGMRKQNLDLLTVFILPEAVISEERTVLLTAILNQIEMLFLLHRSGCLRQPFKNDDIEKEPGHDSDH
ncbi:MAG: hypothetical protein KQI81_12695 [Deltaproteobacteria bacterium]|nr:hypothetical protein [Deltaproteobacteria bacterium]